MLLLGIFNRLYLNTLLAPIYKSQTNFLSVTFHKKISVKVKNRCLTALIRCHFKELKVMSEYRFFLFSNVPFIVSIRNFWF